MGKLLLISGDLAAGKTVFAHTLSERYHVPAFCKDTIKEVLGDTIGFASRAENKKLSHASMALMAYLLESLGRLNASLILEANFHTDELSELHAIAEAYRFDALALILRADTGILYSRYMNRMLHENRHPVHLSTTLDVYDDFLRCSEHLRREAVPGKSILIPADDFSYQSDEGLLAKIDAFMGV